MSPGRRSCSLPRRAGTMQKVQVLLQPTLIETHAAYAESRRVGSVDGKVSSASRISTWRLACCAGPARAAPAGCRCCGCRRRRRPRGPLHDGVAVLLRHAAADGDLHVGLAVLARAQVAEVAVELVVGVLAHGAGVEDDDVGGLGPLGGGDAGDVDIAGGLEQAGEPLGVVDVHLAPVRADLVGADRLSPALRARRAS
jgi:hypothetical protein